VSRWLHSVWLSRAALASLNRLLGDYHFAEEALLFQVDADISAPADNSADFPTSQSF